MVLPVIESAWLVTLEETKMPPVVIVEAPLNVTVAAVVVLKRTLLVVPE